MLRRALRLWCSRNSCTEDKRKERHATRRRILLHCYRMIVLPRMMLRWYLQGDLSELKLKWGCGFPRQHAAARSLEGAIPKMDLRKERPDLSNVLRRERSRTKKTVLFYQIVSGCLHTSMNFCFITFFCCMSHKKWETDSWDPGSGQPIKQLNRAVGNHCSPPLAEQSWRRFAIIRQGSPNQGFQTAWEIAKWRQSSWDVNASNKWHSRLECKPIE